MLLQLLVWLQVAQKEAKQSGEMKSDVYTNYFRANTWCVVVVATFLVMCTYGLVAFTDLWMTFWIAAAESAVDELSLQDNLFYGGIYVGASFGSALMMCAGPDKCR